MLSQRQDGQKGKTMKKMIVNGKEITTNYGANYSLWNGEGKDTMVCRRVMPSKTAWDLLEDFVEEGYTRVTFYETTTCVRGYHQVYAFAKKRRWEV